MSLYLSYHPLPQSPSIFITLSLLPLSIPLSLHILLSLRPLSINLFLSLYISCHSLSLSLKPLSLSLLPLSLSHSPSLSISSTTLSYSPSITTYPTTLFLILPLSSLFIAPTTLCLTLSLSLNILPHSHSLTLPLSTYPTTLSHPPSLYLSLSLLPLSRYPSCLLVISTLSLSIFNLLLQSTPNPFFLSIVFPFFHPRPCYPPSSPSLSIWHQPSFSIFGRLCTLLKIYIIGHFIPLLPLLCLNFTSLFPFLALSLCFPSRLSFLFSLSILDLSLPISHIHPLSVSLSVSLYISLLQSFALVLHYICSPKNNAKNYLANLDKYIQMARAKYVLKINKNQCRYVDTIKNYVKVVL